MQVGLVTGKGRIELREFPEPEATPGRAVVQIAYCGICGTDLHAFQSGEPYNPAICGHEWTGHVSAVGADVHDVREGDRVAIEAESHFELNDGRVYNNTYHFLFLFRDGRICCAKEYNDSRYAAETLRLL